MTPVFSHPFQVKFTVKQFTGGVTCENAGFSSAAHDLFLDFCCYYGAHLCKYLGVPGDAVCGSVTLRTFPFPCHRKSCSPLKSWNSCELRERLAQLQSCQVVEWSPGLSDSSSPKVRLVQHQTDSNTVKWQNQCTWKQWRPCVC